MFEILIYLFERYMHYAHHHSKESKKKSAISPRSIAQDLLSSGFSLDDIVDALDWLKELGEYRANDKHCHSPGGESIRVLTQEEQDKLSSRCQRFLLYLEQVNILTARTREIVLDRAMALHDDHVTLGQLKWIVMLVLFHHTDKKQGFDWLENLMLAECHLETLH
jgi:Smg protein